MNIEQIENRNNPVEEPVDSSSFLNNNIFLVACDVFWSKVCAPVVNFVDGFKERLTRHWTEDQLDDIDERAAQQEALTAQVLKDAEEYRNGQH